MSTLERPVQAGILTYSWVKWTVKINPISRRVIAIGKLHSAHFSYNDGTRVYQPLDSRCSSISGWIEIMESSASTTRSHALQIKNVFDAKPQLF